MSDALAAVQRGAGALALSLLSLGVQAAPVQLEALTSTELRERIAAGTTIALLPIGGTEQNGPHMVLGKHNVRVRALAEQVAERLGNALVAPVIAYVPEGRVDPPESHMRYAGTLSIPEPVFEGVLEGAARSLCHHGFRDIVMLGDHGGYQKSEARVAERLNRDWASRVSPPCRAHALAEYYRASQGEYAKLLDARGYGAQERGEHAGLADTSLALAIDPALVRSEWLGRTTTPAQRPGVTGDPRRASAELGRLGVAHIVEVTTQVIRDRTRAR